MSLQKCVNAASYLASIILSYLRVHRIIDKQNSVIAAKLEESSIRALGKFMQDIKKSDFDSGEDSRTERKRGRPKGRRSDPNYTQISALVPLELHQKIKIALIKNQMKQGIRNPNANSDVSALIEKLLETWLEQQEA